MANTFFDKWVDNRNNIVEDLSPDDPRRVVAQSILDANKRKRERQDAADARAERTLRLKEREADRKDRQEASKNKAAAKREDQKAKAEARKKGQAVQLKKDKRVKDTREILKNTGKFTKEVTKKGDDSLKAGGIVASNLVRTVGAVAKKAYRGAQYAKAVADARPKKKVVKKQSSGDGGDPNQKRLPSVGQTGKKPPMSSAIVVQKKERPGVQARRDPALKAKMIKDRGGTVTEGLRTAVKNVIKKVKAYQKKRKSIVKRDPDATAVATTKGSKMTKYEKQPSSVSKAGSSAVTSTAKKEVAQKKGKETEGQKARRDPEYRKKRIEQDVAAARKWVGRRKAVKAVQSVTQKAKDTATSAKEAGGKLVKSVASGKLARQIKTGAYKAKKAATETGKKVAKATLEKDPTAKAGASARRTVHKVGQKFRRAMSAADRLHRMEKKGLQPGKGKPKSDGKVPDPWNEGFSNWREEFLHEVEQPEMGETDQKEPDSKSKSKKDDGEEKKIDVMKGKNKVEVNPQLKAESFNHPIDSDKHKKAQKVAKIRNLAKGNKNPNEKEAAEKKAGGPKLYGEDFVTERAKSGELNKRPKGAIARARAAQGLSADDRVTDTKYRKLGKVTKKVSRSSKDWRTTDVVEEAPPGREKQVKALKKKFPNDPEAPYKIAWAQHNKESVMIQDANGNDFLEVIDVIKAEPLVPVKEGRINGNGKQEKFNRAMNAYRKAQRAGNLSNKERVDRLKDNAKIRREAEKKEKKGKQFAGGQVYNEETPDAISGKDLKRISALSGKKTRFGDGPEGTAKRKAALEKKRGMKLDDHPQFKEEKLDEISMRTARAAEFLAGKKADDAQKKGDKQTSDIKNYQKYKIGYMIRARERKLDKRKGDLERTFKKS